LTLSAVLPIEMFSLFDEDQFFGRRNVPCGLACDSYFQ
jgi:hypothetical protein